MPTVRVDEEAEQDLDALWDADPDSAAIIGVLLDEMESSNVFAETLSIRFYRRLGNPSYEVKRFEELWGDGLTMYLLKFWDFDGGLVPYRIFYAHHPQKDIFYVLAIINREFEYDTNHPTVHRIRIAYHRLCIPSYR